MSLRFLLAVTCAASVLVLGVLLATHLIAVDVTVQNRACGAAPVAAAKKSPAKLLVLVIGGGANPQYDLFRTFWKLIAAQMRAQDIHVYVLSLDPGLTQPLLDVRAGTICFPGADNLVPGVLNQTVLALELIARRKLPGHDAPLILRTNLSTFWRLQELWLVLARRPAPGPLYGGLVYSFEGTAFATGVAVFWNAETVRVLLERHELLEYASKVDDVAFGAFFPQVRRVPKEARVFLNCCKR